MDRVLLKESTGTIPFFIYLTIQPVVVVNIGEGREGYENSVFFLSLPSILIIIFFMIRFL